MTGYKIYRKGFLLATVNPALTTYSNPGLTAKTTYSYKVSAYDAAGNESSQSTSSSATTQAATANIINAVSCKRVDVQAAIDSAVNRDTVRIPAGTCQWDNAVTLAKGITIQGAGIDATIIKRYGFTVSANTDNWRVTGITWNGESTSARVFLINTSKNWRIDNIKINDYPNNKMIYIRGYSYGLIDSCQMINIGNEAIDYAADGITAFGRSDDYASVADSDRYTNGTVYIEDCTFSQTSRTDAQIVDASEGARYVFRYNTINNNVANGYEMPLDMHGYCETGQPTSTVGVEIYRNTINDNVGDWGSSGTGFKIRAGYSTIHDNIVPPTWNQLVKISDQRSQVGAGVTVCGDKTRCGNLDSCLTGTDNPTFPYCDYQIHNTYFWGNTKNGSPFNKAYLNGNGCTSAHLVEGEAYHTGIPYPDYVEYTYPHPLRGESTADAQAPTTTVFPQGGTYISSQSVTLTPNETATTYYTTDGTTPTASSTVYSSPITISADTTLELFSVDTAGNQETVQTETYIIFNGVECR